ncbi:unnamed protein product [Acanthosepion pharaonis]|uniref:Uncharacterized protein n=1 Tax=Acanthosepion pharaonis TaxID=158019 RepID=A0A812BMT8_ACAPH|nr:unnamed protein product [Sepia pharaonis]
MRSGRSGRSRPVCSCLCSFSLSRVSPRYLRVSLLWTPVQRLRRLDFNYRSKLFHIVLLGVVVFTSGIYLFAIPSSAHWPSCDKKETLTFLNESRWSLSFTSSADEKFNYFLPVFFPIRKKQQKKCPFFHLPSPGHWYTFSLSEFSVFLSSIFFSQLKTNILFFHFPSSGHRYIFSLSEIRSFRRFWPALSKWLRITCSIQLFLTFWKLGGS